MRGLIKTLLCSLALCSTMFLGEAYAGTKEESYAKVFDANYYYENYPDLQATIGTDPQLLFEHFLTSGMKEGRSGNEEFNIRTYIFNNPDLLNVFKTDYAKYCDHYIETGKAEGRISTTTEPLAGIIGTYTTYYDPNKSRATNIATAVSRINGVVLQPGESFSYSDTLLPRRTSNGYVSAPVIGGSGMGGGICQVSSTLYAAMCHALLQPTERFPHSSRVSYMPVGLDATIWSGHKDLKFVNTFSKPLAILSEIVVAENEAAVTVTLYLHE